MQRQERCRLLRREHQTVRSVEDYDLRSVDAVWGFRSRCHSGVGIDWHHLVVEGLEMKTLENAGKSVRRRGFLDSGQGDWAADPILMSQVLRLQEEVGEFARSFRSENGPSFTELADIVIVCAAIAEYEGWSLDTVVGIKCAADERERGYRHRSSDDGHVYVDKQ